MAGMAPHLTTLSPELLHGIFVCLDPQDLKTLPVVCRALYGFVQGNQALCRELYLKLLDKPDDMNLDWTREIDDVVRLQKICARPSALEKKHELPFVHYTVIRLLKHASSAGQLSPLSKTHAASRNVDFLRELFDDGSNREAFMQRSFLFERVRNTHRPARFSAEPREHHQQSARLHCLYGKPILDVGRTRSARTYPYACSKVYDLREYTDLTRWGPFRNDTTGRVDWEKMEAILIVLGSNMSTNPLVSTVFRDVWDSPFSGAWANSFAPSPHLDLPPSLADRDPYGITGTWYRVVCFLDYNDFFNFNFPMGDMVPADAPRPALDVGEAARLIVVRIRVTAVHPPGPGDGQDLPVVHFHGVSQSLDDWDNVDDEDSDARVDGRGTVRLTKEGEVHWTTISIFHGQERWRSEGIQIGGLRSARGVFGNWFDRDYDVHGPAGPTAFWKVSDSENPRDVIREMVPSEFFMTPGAVHDDDDDDDDDGGVGSDSEDDEEFNLDNNNNNDDEDEDMEPDAEGVSSEIAGLLRDAEMEVSDVAGSIAEEDQNGSAR